MDLRAVLLLVVVGIAVAAGLCWIAVAVAVRHSRSDSRTSGRHA